MKEKTEERGRIEHVYSYLKQQRIELENQRLFIRMAYTKDEEDTPATNLDVLNGQIELLGDIIYKFAFTFQLDEDVRHGRR